MDGGLKASLSLDTHRVKADRHAVCGLCKGVDDGMHIPLLNLADISQSAYAEERVGIAADMKQTGEVSQRSDEPRTAIQVKTSVLMPRAKQQKLSCKRQPYTCTCATDRHFVHPVAKHQVQHGLTLALVEASVISGHAAWGWLTQYSFPHSWTVRSQLHCSQPPKPSGSRQSIRRERLVD